MIQKRYVFLFSSVQSLSHVRLFPTPWIAAHQASLSITNSRSSLNSRPSSRWCHPAISSSVVPFSSCPQSFPASEYFPVSQLFAWGGQSTRVSALASFLPKNKEHQKSLCDWLFVYKATTWVHSQHKGCLVWGCPSPLVKQWTKLSSEVSEHGSSGTNKYVSLLCRAPQAASC